MRDLNVHIERNRKLLKEGNDPERRDELEARIAALVSQKRM